MGGAEQRTNTGHLEVLSQDYRDAVLGRMLRLTNEARRRRLLAALPAGDPRIARRRQKLVRVTAPSAGLTA
jgi:hypothetical protein